MQHIYNILLFMYVIMCAALSLTKKKRINEINSGLVADQPLSIEMYEGQLSTLSVQIFGRIDGYYYRIINSMLRVLRHGSSKVNLNKTGTWVCGKCDMDESRSQIHP